MDFWGTVRQGVGNGMDLLLKDEEAGSKAEVDGGAGKLRVGGEFYPWLKAYETKKNHDCLFHFASLAGVANFNCKREAAPTLVDPEPKIKSFSQ